MINQVLGPGSGPEQTNSQVRDARCVVGWIGSHESCGPRVPGVELTTRQLSVIRGRRVAELLRFGKGVARFKILMEVEYQDSYGGGIERAE